ncbi:MAG TPA: hypothetical protein VEB86_19135 [Chryseosolibacter sp.]|nr:hypothetical protein [Chryseosolibacter sp.]
MVICLTYVLNRYRPVTAGDKEFEWNRLWIFKTHSTNKYDCIVAGDSRVYRGISASAIEKELEGLSVFNFGYSSGSFSSFMLDQIENRLDLNSKRPIVLLGVTPYSLTEKAMEDEHFREQLAKKKEEILEYLYFEPLKRFFHPYSIQELYEARKTADSGGTVYHQESFYRQGWVASWKIPPDPKAALPGYVKDFASNRVSPVAIDTLVDRVGRWTRNGIEVYGFRPPTTVEMVQLENNLSGFQESLFVQRFQDAGGRWIDLDISEYQSYDGSHLAKSSAIKVSERIGKHISGREP